MKRKLWFLVGVLHWGLSFWTDGFVFDCEIPWLYAVWKAVFLLFTAGFYQLVGWLVYKVKSGDRTVRGILKYALPYFLVMLVFLILTWPGIWRIDEFSLLRTAKQLHLHYWQSYLTSVYYILCLMMIPAPVSVVLFMCVINAGIVGYLVYKLGAYTGERKLAYLLYLPFLFFPVIDSNLYPMRMSIYAFAELLLLAKLCFWVYEKRIPERKELLAELGTAALVTVWRTESIYYILLFPVLLGVFFWKKISPGRLAKQIGFYLVCTLVLIAGQKQGESDGGDSYEITSVIRPLTPLVVEAAFAGETDLIADVDKVINCANIFQGASEGENGLGIFWRWVGNGLIKDNYTAEDYRDFKRAYYTLILRHPTIFLKERWQTYRESTGLLGNINEVQPPSPVINDRLRKTVYSVLELRSMEDYYTQGKAAAAVYSTIFPSLILAAGCLLFLWKRKLVYAGALLLVFLKVPLVFLTSPGCLFMYYYSPYLCGWAFLFFAGILFLIYKQGRNGDNKSKN